jgi:hypothetical protein
MTAELEKQPSALIETPLQVGSHRPAAAAPQKKVANAPSKGSGINY